MLKNKPAKKKKVRTRDPSYSTKAFEKLLRRTDSQGRYVLKLYITGTTQRSIDAVANIRSLCEEYLASRYDLEVVDIYQQPSMAAGQQIIAAPTLVKEFPAPSKRMIGNLNDRSRVLVGLDLRKKARVSEPAKTVWSKL